MKLDYQSKLLLLLGVFITAVILANFLGIKVIELFGVNISVGIFLFPVLFLITDIVSEVAGKKVANLFVVIALISLLITVGFTLFAITVAPGSRFEMNSEYSQVFGLTLRITIASLIAFALAQFNDVALFHHLKQKTNNKWLWLRNNVSTLVSQAIDSFVFIFIAFYGVSEKFDLGFVFELALSYYIFKIVFALLDTPLVYAGVKWLRSSQDDKLSVSYRDGNQEL